MKYQKNKQPNQKMRRRPKQTFLQRRHTDSQKSREKMLSITHYWKKCLFTSFSHILIELFVFLVLSCMTCFFILEINLLSVVSFAIIFSHSEGCLFPLFMVSFAVQKFVNLIRSHLLFLFLFLLL